MSDSATRSEPEMLADMVDINVDFVARSPYPAQRSEHGKGVADVRGTFRVIDDLSPPFRVGLFANPETYDATIRFSNGAVQKDNKRDTHGFAVKVHDVPMDSAPKDDDGVPFQDFIMLDCPTFIMGSMSQYVPFNRIFLDAKVSVIGKLRLGWYLLTHPQMIRLVLRMALNKPNAPLSTPYWSTTPYRFGEHVVKYKSVPATPNLSHPRIIGPNGRRAALKKQLSGGTGRFTFGIIMQNNAKTQPIEDPGIDWEKHGASFHPLAEICIPSDQEIAAPPEIEYALSYSPGHSAREHFPLGAINRARVAIYAAAKKARRAAYDKRQ
tara:strand:- start:3618 stop:4589 length:972 start_codon:yes stop_codon:yes gene_type:complete